MTPTVLQVEYAGALAPYDRERAALADAGARLEIARCADADELVQRAGVADVIWLEWRPAITRAVLRQLPRCSLVMRWGVGYDQIDVAAASEMGIAVANSPAHCTQDVAEHTMALLLAVTRDVVDAHRGLAGGGWRERRSTARRLQDATVGVIGLGRIGRRVAQLCGAFGAGVVGYDSVVTDVPGVRSTSLPDLLVTADVVTVHVPLTASTRHLVGRAGLAAMKDGAALINTSRGEVIDQTALLAELQSGRLRAGLDVFDPEPIPDGHPVRTAPNLVITPHLGATSPSSLDALRTAMCETTVQWLRTGWAATVVNPEIRGRQRIPAAAAP